MESVLIGTNHWSYDQECEIKKKIFFYCVIGKFKKKYTRKE